MPLFVGGCGDGLNYEVEKIGGRYPVEVRLARLVPIDVVCGYSATPTKVDSSVDVYYFSGGAYVFDHTMGHMLAPPSQPC